MSFTSKLYIWSIMFEPLLLFVFSFSDNLLGVSMSVGRVLQLIVLLLLVHIFILKILNKSNLNIINNFFPENKYLILYFVMIIFSGLIGVMIGSYSLPFNTNPLLISTDGTSLYLSRSLFEYFITLFNVIYFAILPRHLIKTKIEFDYLFSVFMFFFITSLFFGYADFILTKLEITELLPRHLRDGVAVGPRFHGLGGEPRQAAVHMIFNLSMYFLYCKYFNFKIRTSVILLILLALILTSSMTLFIGLIIFIIFLFLFRLIDLKFVIILIPFLFIMFSYDRISNYVYTILEIWEVLESGEELPYLLKIIRGETYPVYDFIIKVRDFDLIPVLFGNGIGSSSAINNRYIGEYIGIANPNSQLVRVLSETGILGIIIFIVSMIWPIKYHTSNTDKKSLNLYLISMFLILSITFSVRSPVVFIYFGILTSFLHFHEKKIKY